MPARVWRRRVRARMRNWRRGCSVPLQLRVWHCDTDSSMGPGRGTAPGGGSGEHGNAATECRGWVGAKACRRLCTSTMRRSPRWRCWRRRRECTTWWMMTLRRRPCGYRRLPGSWVLQLPRAGARRKCRQLREDAVYYATKLSGRLNVPDVILIGTGSEVDLCVVAREKLKNFGGLECEGEADSRVEAATIGVAGGVSDRGERPVNTTPPARPRIRPNRTRARGTLPPCVTDRNAAGVGR